MAKPSLAGRSILIVDDEDVYLRSVVEGFARELPGVELFTAHNGSEALALLGINVVDLVVTDVNMPRMDGLGLVAAMVSRGMRIPVIMVTAYGGRQVEFEARRHGVISVLDKPIEFSYLVDVCRNALLSLHNAGMGGVTLPGLLQLLEMEQRNCTVRIFNGKRSGRIYVEGGQVVGSQRGDAMGMDAMREILAWDKPEIELGPLRMSERSAPIPLQAMLLESARREDELSRELELIFEEESVPTRPPATPERAPPPISPAEPAPERTPAVSPPEVSQPSPTRKPTSTRDPGREKAHPSMANVDQSINTAMNIQGCVAAALVDYESGMCLGSKANGFPIEVAAAGNTEVIRSKLRVMNDLGIEGGITDILITLDPQYHLLVPLSQGTLFLYVAIDRKSGNLAMARHKLAAIEKALVV